MTTACTPIGSVMISTSVGCRAPRSAAARRLLRHRVGRSARPTAGDSRVREAGCGAHGSGHAADHRRGQALGDGPDHRGVLCLQDRIVRLRANQTGATTRDITPWRRSRIRSASSRSSGLRNPDRIIGDYGMQRDRRPQDPCRRLNKTLVDILITSEFLGRPRRFATGIELTEEPVLDDDGNPVLDEDDQPVMTEVEPFPGDPSNDGQRERRSQVRAARPPPISPATRRACGSCSDKSWPCRRCPRTTSVSFTEQPGSADALRAAEASLTARAEARQPRSAARGNRSHG